MAYDPSEPEVVRRMIRETEGGFDEIVDFAGNEKSMAFAVSVVARGGKIVELRNYGDAALNNPADSVSPAP